MSASGRAVVLTKRDSTAVAAERPAVAELARRYGEGESVKVLAKECGVSDERVRQMIQTWCLTGEGDESYADLVTRALAARVVESDAKLEAATDMLTVNKQAHVSRYARMDYERRRPGLYGAKPLQVNVGVVNVDAELVGTMGEHLERLASGRVIEGDK